MLDQAIAHAKGSLKTEVKAGDLRLMLGLADRSRIIDLFMQVMKGDIAAALASLKALYDAGADPGRVLGELAEFVHFVTRLKLAPESGKDPAITQEERVRGGEFAERLALPVLSRAWQLLLKGLQEVRDLPRPLAAADMVLVRLAYAADLPTPDETLRRLGQQPATAAPAPVRASAPAGGGVRGSLAASLGAVQAKAPLAAPQTSPEPQLRLARFEDVVALAAAQRDIQLKVALEHDVRLVRFEEGSIEFALSPGASAQIAQQLTRRLQEWTGRRWMVAISSEIGAPSLSERAEAAAAATMLGVRADPFVQRALALFPGAEIIGVRGTESPDAAEQPLEPGDDIAYADQAFSEDDL